MKAAVELQQDQEMIVGIASFAAGFVTGWMVRSTVESSRGLTVKLGAGAVGLRDVFGRAITTEREFLEDLWAEVRSRVHADDEESAAASETSAPKPVASQANGGAA
ncbi:hypothetical protein AKJ09_03228 [Labilithrix luteola]|uniref:Uncharacterized protein n=1 Tax=Labilithrix luteola TaxID=1391654 RepID=A0A0K1PTV6_9BACT|nr:hypothetical protein [Labilithrix luteola]AKU96564.1 hypothetical protein AKJ09_03228 [Labilithrix luteola]